MQIVYQEDSLHEKTVYYLKKKQEKDYLTASAAILTQGPVVQS